MGSPKKMGPPDEVVVEEMRWEEKLDTKGDEGVVVGVGFEDGGRVSQDRVRRHDCRIMEKEVGCRGS